jgi:MoxR-like ATPase
MVDESTGRFLIRLDLGYPGEQEELEILRRRRGSRSDAITLPQLLKGGELLAMQSFPYPTGSRSASRSASQVRAAAPWHLGQCRLRQLL